MINIEVFSKHNYFWASSNDIDSRNLPFFMVVVVDISAVFSVAFNREMVVVVDVMLAIIEKRKLISAIVCY